MMRCRGDDLGGLRGSPDTLGRLMGLCYCEKGDAVCFRCSDCAVVTFPWTATCGVLAAGPLPSLLDEVRQTVKAADHACLA